MSLSTEAEELAAELTIHDCEVHTGESRPEIMEYLHDEATKEDEKQGYAFAPDKWGPIQWDGWDRTAGGRIEYDNYSVPFAEDLDEQREKFGIDTTVFSPGPIFRIVLIPDHKTRIAYMRAANDLIVDRFARGDGDYYAKMYILGDHPRESAEEIRRVGDEDGIVGAFLTDTGVTQPLGHESYDPIYEAAEETDIPIILHSTTGITDAYPAGGMKPKSFLEYHTLSHTFAKMWHASTIITRGVPERFDVDFGFWEAGFSWVQTLANRMDREFVERPNEAPLLEKMPSEYLSDFYYGSQPLEEPANPEWLGDIVSRNDLDDQIVFTTDYPHMDFDAPRAVLDHPGLTREQKTKMVQDNPREFFGI